MGAVSRHREDGKGRIGEGRSGGWRRGERFLGEKSRVGRRARDGKRWEAEAGRGEEGKRDGAIS